MRSVDSVCYLGDIFLDVPAGIHCQNVAVGRACQAARLQGLPPLREKLVESSLKNRIERVHEQKSDL